MLCSESIVVNRGEGARRAITLYCRSWSCEICQPRRKRELQQLAANGEPNAFITLTCNPAVGASPDERAQALVTSWRVVMARAKKQYGYAKIPYLCVFEATKRGEPHLHIIARVPWIDQRWLSRQMEELTQAPIVDIRRVKSARQVASYVAKYIGKQPHVFRGCKRYWRTQDFDLSTPQEDDSPVDWSNRWDVENVTLETQTWLWQQQGLQIEERDGMVYAWDPWHALRAARAREKVPPGTWRPR